MGMLPTEAVKTRMLVYEFGIPRHNPKIEEMKTVRLKAHWRPIQRNQSG